MGVLRHRRIRRQDIPLDDDDDDSDSVNDGDGDDDDDDDESQIATSSSIGLPSTTKANSYDKAKAIGQEVIKKAPSK
jgi:hypothetical protein